MNILKQKAIVYFEKAIGKTGHVLAVRAWEPATIFEIDVHLPGINMHSWQSAQHIKVRVGDFHFRDYSPALWDAETSTCTLIIDAAHEGAGSNWVRGLSAGDTITHVGVAGTFHKPVPAGGMVCLGDASALGHFLALEQLAGKRGVTGSIALAHPQHVADFGRYFETSLQPVLIGGRDAATALFSSMEPNQFAGQTIFIAGNITAVVQLRKMVRQQPGFSGSIKPQGFWK